MNQHAMHLKKQYNGSFLVVHIFAFVTLPFFIRAFLLLQSMKQCQMTYGYTDDRKSN